MIIAGGRDFSQYPILEEKCKKVLSILKSEGYFFECKETSKKSIEIISGVSNGAETLEEKFANKFGLKVVRFPANWEKYGKVAGYKRNEEMVSYAKEDQTLGVLIAFWNKRSNATSDMINFAKKYGLRVFVFNYGQGIDNSAFHQ
jgi:hypothetical protein